MLIYRGLYATDRKPVALTIGNFDGVHLGHQALLTKVKEVGNLHKWSSAVIVFEPHPREFFTPQQAPVRLTNLREKLELFADMGIDRVHVCRFNRSFAQMSAADFASALHEKLAAKYVLIGDDFRFGSKRSGDFSLMASVGAECGFEVQAMHSMRTPACTAYCMRVYASPAPQCVQHWHKEICLWLSLIWGGPTASAGE